VNEYGSSLCKCLSVLRGSTAKCLSKQDVQMFGVGDLCTSTMVNQFRMGLYLSGSHSLL
jgi:hypothetical protein